MKRIGVTRAHLEGDAGKLVHPPGADYSLVDLNRAETPLLEIVSEPDMRSAAEAKAYAQELYHVMRYAGVSDADLYYGNMRFDVNVSLRPEGSDKFGTRTESKNLNSFRAVEGVVEYEIKRQSELLDKGQKVVQETRGWDEAKKKTFTQRTKEEAHDYRYFPEPDLPPLWITRAMLGEAKSAMPERMPNDLRSHLKELGIPSQDAEILVGNMVLSSRFIEASDGAGASHSKRIANWLVNDVLGEIQSVEKPEAILPKPENLHKLSLMVEDNKVSSTNAKKIVVEALLRTEEDPEVFAEKKGYIQVSDTGAIENIVDEIIKANPKPVEDYQNGEKKVLGFLVGQVMKASKGQANPPMVNDILKKKLGS